MPIPTPNKDEKEKDFIARCMRTLAKNDPDRPQEQRAAICYSKWRGKKKEESSEIGASFIDAEKEIIKFFTVIEERNRGV